MDKAIGVLWGDQINPASGLIGRQSMQSKDLQMNAPVAYRDRQSFWGFILKPDKEELSIRHKDRING